VLPHQLWRAVCHADHLSRKSFPISRTIHQMTATALAEHLYRFTMGGL
jgi:hypothetical protein